MVQSVGRCEGVFQCLEELRTIPSHLASRFHQERTENHLESTLRTYSDFFLFQSVRFFLPYAPRATNKRSIISVAKANKVE